MRRANYAAARATVAANGGAESLPRLPNAGSVMSAVMPPTADPPASPSLFNFLIICLPCWLLNLLIVLPVCAVFVCEHCVKQTFGYAWVSGWGFVRQFVPQESRTPGADL